MSEETVTLHVTLPLAEAEGLARCYEQFAALLAKTGSAAWSENKYYGVLLAKGNLVLARESLAIMQGEAQ